jgi:hypothetical protein
MRSRYGLALAIALVVALPGGALAKCGDDPGDAAQVAATRAVIAADCPCGGFTNHGQYVKCARGVANDRADANLLPKSCKGSVVSCAAHSTCSKPGFVTCCRTDAKGKTKCSTKNGAAHCTAPRNGSACVGTQSSCCDACTASGCAGSPSGAFIDGTSFTLF